MGWRSFYSRWSHLQQVLWQTLALLMPWVSVPYVLYTFPRPVSSHAHVTRFSFCLCRWRIACCTHGICVSGVHVSSGDPATKGRANSITASRVYVCYHSNAAWNCSWDHGILASFTRAIKTKVYILLEIGCILFANRGVMIFNGEFQNYRLYHEVQYVIM